MSPRCSLICVGSELLRGKINTHASTLARRLASIGIHLSREQTVSDDISDLTRAIRRALAEDPIVIVTGGLGPTFDDLTREAAAEAVGRRLQFSPALLKDIVRKFKRARLQKMPKTNERQAYLIEGARAIDNRNGTAPGQWLEVEGKILILLPGPPSELHPMLEDSILPKLKKAFPRKPSVEAHLHFVGVPESKVDERIRPIIAKEPDVDFTILAHLGLVDFDIFISDTSLRRAEAKKSRIVKKIRAVMGRAFYGMDQDYPLEKVVMDRYVSRKMTLAVAESCTGGLLSKTLTDVAGSSAYFSGGIVSYSNELKMASLGVHPKTLKKYGAVSKETALEMAQGVRRVCCSTWGLSITGIAGPGGGTSKKPIGLVYIALSGPSGNRSYEFHLRGSRDAIRQRAVTAVLDLLRR